MKKKDKMPDLTGFADELPEAMPVAAFSAEDLVSCPHCRRKNPPTKFRCLYCGEIIEPIIREIFMEQPILRRPDISEKGFNLILLAGNEKPDRTKIPLLGDLLKINREVVERLLETGETLPLIRADSETELETVRQIISRWGFESFILSDEALRLDVPPRRLRGIGFEDDTIRLILFNSSAEICVLADELALIVTGAIYRRKFGASEKRGRSGEKKLLDSEETFSDDFLLDIYTHRDDVGYRIQTNGFDFSCLGVEKGYIGLDNIKKLAGKLKKECRNARLVENYKRIRSVLENVWEIEQKRETGGIKRVGIGKFSFENTSVSTNLEQFTRYSRLQRHLL